MEGVDRVSNLLAVLVVGRVLRSECFAQIARLRPLNPSFFLVPQKRKQLIRCLSTPSFTCLSIVPLCLFGLSIYATCFDLLADDFVLLSQISSLSEL